ncbi:MAG TPA: PAS domain-containing protein [Actinomycetota bacterium]|nr:PAS domain-containing protein [Actinomycetota bacterium]
MTIAPRFEHGFIEGLFEVAHIGLGLVDLDLRYVRVNDALAAMNGVAPEDHAGQAIREVLPDLADLAEPLLRHVIESKEPVVDLELHGATPADPEADRHFLASYYPVLDGDAAIGVGAVVVEVTDRVRAHRELTQQAHEIYENVVQDLTVVQLALEQGDARRAASAAQRALGAAKRIASKVLLEDLIADA